MEDLNTLYYFTQVVEHHGFAAAGRALDMPKSKLSRRIAALEFTTLTDLALRGLAAPHVVAALGYRRDSPEALGYYAVSPRVRWEYGCYYIVLTAFLAMMTHDVSEQLKVIQRGGDMEQSGSGEV